MTIRKGETWGELRVPANPVHIHSDRDLSRLLGTASATTTYGLLGGDLMRTVGGAGDVTRLSGSEPIPHLPVDIVGVVADGVRSDHFVAHLVARQSWWRGRLVAAMNAQFIGNWDVAPRSHPNDGRVDIVDVSADFGLQQRWMARSRVRLGTHLPHPAITVIQRSSAVIDFAEPTAVWLDGERWGSAQRVELTVVADVLTICV